MTPASRPRATRAQVTGIASEISRISGNPLGEVYVVAVRGYYRDTMGKPGTNDRGIYDDAVFVVGPETFAAFNANTDPSRFRPGIASLLPGIYPYRLGKHGISRPGGGYPAFRPATKNEALPVRRDGEAAVPSKRPGIAINIHRGGRNTTSSEGCQTIPPTQWDAFYALLTKELKAAGQKTFQYILLDGPIV